MKIFNLFAICLYLLSALVSAATVESASSYYAEGKFDEAYEDYLKLSQLGNSKAMFNIGVMNARGESVEKNIVEAAAWVKLSIEYGFEGARVLGLLEKKLSDEQLEKASLRLKKLLSKYAPSVIKMNILPSYEELSGGEFNVAKMISKSLPKYPRAALREYRDGYVDVSYSIAKDGTTRNHQILSSSSSKFERNAMTAIRKSLYQPATINGKPIEEFGRRMRFSFLIAGEGLDHNTVNGFIDGYISELRENADNGGGQEKYIYAYSLGLVNSMYGKREGLEIENPTPWFAKAAQEGNRFAQYELGLNLLYGQQCAIDSAKSLFWIRKAAEEGVTDAQLILGSEYIRGGRYTTKRELGYQWLERAANGGLDAARIMMAWKLSTDRDGLFRNPEKAEKFLNMIDHKSFADKVGIYETKSAVYAAKGDFENAQKWQKKLIKEAKKLELPLGPYEKGMERIKARKLKKG